MPLFQLEFRRPNGEEPIQVVPQGEVRPQDQDGVTIWTWPSLRLGEAGSVRVQVTKAPAQGGEAWSIEVDPQSEEYGLWSLRFPVLDIGPDAEVEYVVPWNMGVRMGFTAEERRFPYPSCTAAMQFTAAYRREDQTGVYMGAHDPTAHYKAFCYRSEDGQGRVMLEQFPEEMGVPSHPYRQPYPVILRPLQQGWYQAARFYREWVDPKPTPYHWGEDIDAWFRLRRGFGDEDLQILEEWSKEIDAQMAIHLYLWHPHPFDSNYPRYLPPKPGFREAIARLKRVGIKSMPYINARLWDSADPSWEECGAAPYAIRQANGEKVNEVYASKVPLSPMCPTTDFWHDTIVEIVGGLREEGVESIYLDQIGAAYPIPCFNPDHGHPLGGGDHWVQGYRRLMARLRQEFPDLAFTTEENADCFLDLFDAVLICNGPDDADTGGLVPLYPAVYGGATPYWAVQYFKPRDYASPGFRLRLARELCWGAQIGWFDPYAPIQPQDFAYFKETVKIRKELRQFFNQGELLPLPQIQAPMVRVPVGVEEEADACCVVMGRWSLGQKTAEVIANVSSEEVEARFVWADREETLTLGPYEIRMMVE